MNILNVKWSALSIDTFKSIINRRQFKLVVGGVLGGLMLIGLVMGTFETIFANKNYPGLTVAGTNVGGMNREQSQDAIKGHLQKINTLNLVYGNSRWSIPVEDFDLTYDYVATADKLHNTGRTGRWVNDLNLKFEAWKNRVVVEPVFTMDENKLVELISGISTELDIPAQEPEITVSRDGEVVRVQVTQGENGQQTNTRQLLQQIKGSLKNGTAQTIQIPVVNLRPRLTEPQMEEARRRSENLIGKSVTINFPEENNKWEITDETMVSWIDPVNSGWKKDQIEGWINQLSEGVDRVSQNASLKFENGRVEEFKPAHDGFRVKRAEMTEMITEELRKVESGSNAAQILLITESFPPELKTSDVNSLGIKEIIGKGESWFSGSINNRIFNLKKSAEALSGVLIAPGETFSFNHQVGEISAATGYKPAYIIKEGKTILGDGGGVCQTSSTLFRAVLAAGLPIEERVAHAYRVHYYEENYQVGFDATIFQPSPDFKFKNDTPGHILIQMKFEEGKKHLVFELYGTSDGRKVELSKSRTWEITPPPPDLYVDDPTLPVGKVNQVEHKAWGAKVAFDWKVVRGDEVLQDRTFYSNYRSWQAVYMRGTKPL